MSKAAKVHDSPSGLYRLRIWLSKKIPGYWQWSIAEIENISTHENISVVHRNYPAFPFAWAEGHPDGHNYLLCGEDYQGQTVIQLDTGLRKDYLPIASRMGTAFCWVLIDDIDLESHPPQVQVIGCYWGAGEENVLYDFSSPMDLPYREIERWDTPFDEEDED
jgi:hypothetical protein